MATTILIAPADYAQMLLNCTGFEPDAERALVMLLDGLRNGEGVLRHVPSEWVADVIHSLAVKGGGVTSRDEG